jgi:pyruvate dehydrogenase E2 component (dihydrolipoamide acetyltransferase)
MKAPLEVGMSSGGELPRPVTVLHVEDDEQLANAARPAPTPELNAGPPYRIARWRSGVRAAVARNVARSAATPVFRVVAALAVDPLRKSAETTRVSFTLLLARAAALAVRANPLFNAAYTDAGLAMRDRVDVGIAVDTPDGLIAAVVRDVANRSIDQLAADWFGLRERLSSRRMKPEDYQGASFYLSNLGTFSVVRSFDAVLPLGATAILSVGAATSGLAVFTLGCDHRVVAGADAARFLQSFAEFLAKPDSL